MELVKAVAVQKQCFWIINLCFPTLMKSYCRLIIVIVIVMVTDDSSVYNRQPKCWLDCVYIFICQTTILRQILRGTKLYCTCVWFVCHKYVCVVVSECSTMSLTANHILSPSSVWPIPRKTDSRSPTYQMIWRLQWMGGTSEPWSHLHRDNITGRAIAENRFVEATSWIKDQTDL